MEKIIALLRRAFPALEIRENEPLSRHCSFRIGGPCAAMLLPRTVDEAGGALRALQDLGVPPLLIGNGTNLLVTDAPLDRIVLKTERLADVARDGETALHALAGISLAQLAVFAQRCGLSGLEFAHGIPGTLGGAVVMNAGAYGGEMKDVVTHTMYMDAAGELLGLEGAEHDFAYRHSVFSDSDSVVLGCRLELTPGDGEAIRARMAELAVRRRESQPLDKPSAGSTFKRPATGYAAAMIDEAGLKGYRVGGAAVSDKHAGFVVNLGGATFDDVLAVMEHVQETVYKKFGVRLEPEVRIIR